MPIIEGVGDPRMGRAVAVSLWEPYVGLTKQSHGNRRKVAPASPANRARVTNGSAVLPGVDGRSAPARRYRDLLRGFLEQTAGRHDALCRQLATLVLTHEQLSARVVRGEHVEPDELIRLAGSIDRLHRRLGLDTAPAAPEPAKLSATEMAIAAVREGA